MIYYNYIHSFLISLHNIQYSNPIVILVSILYREVLYFSGQFHRLLAFLQVTVVVVATARVLFAWVEVERYSLLRRSLRVQADP